MKAASFFFVVALALCQTGCASLYQTFVTPGTPRVYAGTRFDGRIFACAATREEVSCGVEHTDLTTLWFFWVPFAGFDLPLSVVVDTALLPYTVVANEIQE